MRTTAVSLLVLTTLACGTGPSVPERLPEIDVPPAERVSDPVELTVGEALAVPPLTVKEWLADPPVAVAYASEGMSLVRLDTGKVIATHRGRFTLGPAGWVQDGDGVDAMVSLEDGEVTTLMAKLPSGRLVSSEAVFPHPTEPRIHVFAEEGGQAYSGVWTGGSDEVDVSHPVPFLPDGASGLGDHTFAMQFAQLRGGHRGCGMLTLPADGRSTCVTEADVVADAQYPLGDHVFVQEEGQPAVLDDDQLIVPEETCLRLTLTAMSVVDERAAFVCGTKVVVWEEGASWVATTQLEPRSDVAVGRVIPEGEAFGSRTRWLSLALPAIVNTVPLHAQMFNQLGAAQFAAYDDTGEIYWVDLEDQMEVVHVGTADCPGRLMMNRDDPHSLLCRAQDSTLLASYLVGPEGWWTTPRLIEGVKDGKVLLSNKTGIRIADHADRLWLVDDPRSTPR